jgi:hypothetical protein
MNKETPRNIPFPAIHNYSSATTSIGTSKRTSSSTLPDSQRCRKRFRLMQDAFRSLSFGDSTFPDANASNSPIGTTALKETNNNSIVHTIRTNSAFLSETKRRGSSNQITYLDPNRDGHTIFDLDDDDSFVEEEEVESTAMCNNFNGFDPYMSTSSKIIEPSVVVATSTTTSLLGDSMEAKKSQGGLLLEDDEDSSRVSNESQDQSTEPVTILPPILLKERKRQFLSAVDTKIESLIRESRFQASLQQQKQQQQQQQRHKLLNHQGKLVSTFSQDDFRLQSSFPPPPPPLSSLPRQRSNSFSDYSNNNEAEEMMLLD